jgi:hypothetical protein
VTVTPAQVSVVVNATQQFNAAVQGTGNFNKAVNWFVAGVAGGNSTVGTINVTGLFTAPSTVPSPSVVSVTAKSTQDSSKSGTSSTTISPEKVAISVSPTSASLQLGATQKFDVSVTGTANQAFYWTINGQPSNAVTPWGTIDDTGLYTAPSTLPSNPKVNLTATSMEDQTKSVSAVATLLATAGGITVTITPQNPQVSFDGSQSVHFTATVTGAANTAVTWSADPGAGDITSDGVFTPLSFICGNAVPSTVIHAVSVVNPGAQAATTVNLVPPAPVMTKISPQPADAEANVHISGTYSYGAAATVFFPGPNGTIIPTIGYITSATTVTAAVPLGSTSGPLILQQNCSAGLTGIPYSPQQSNSINFQRQPRIRIRTDRKDLSAGESVQLHAVMMGESTPLQVQWGSGITSSGMYTAPSQVSSDTFVTLSACIQNTTECDSLIVRVNPVKIDPDAPIVANTGTLQLSAAVGGADVVPTWSILAGGGNLQSNGLYTAPAALEDSGPVLVSATYGSASSRASIGVTGSYPGLINRVNDYLDNSTATPPTGTITQSLAVDGNRAYVLSVDSLIQWGTPKYCWIDAYDITDAAHPVWMDAVEALNVEPSSGYCAGALFAYGGFLIELLDQEIAVFASQNGHLALQHVYTIPTIFGYTFNQGIIYAIPGDVFGEFADSVIAYVFDLRTGSLVQTNLNLPFPQSATYGQIFTPVGKGNLVYFLVNLAASPAPGIFKIAVYDLSLSTPALVATADAMVGSPSAIGGTLALDGNTLFDGWDVYDISNTIPVRIGKNFNVLEAINSARSLSTSGNEVIDISDPVSPVVKGVLDDGSLSPRNPTWVGDLLYEIDTTGGLAIYSATPPGGPIPLDSLNGGGVDGVILDQIVDGTTLYTTQQSDGPLVAFYDLTSSPPAFIGSYSETGQNPLSLAISGHFLFVGTQEDLFVLDVSNPSSPAKVATLPLPAVGLAIVGNSLFVGTTDSRLVVVDVTNPQAPVQSAQIPLPEIPNRVRSAGNLLYVSDLNSGLLIYSISNPKSPVLVTQYKLSTAVTDSAVDGNLAYLAAAESGLVILDITNPAAPVTLSQTLIDALTCFVDCSNPAATAVGVYGGVVYVGSFGTIGAKVFGFDTRVPSHPRLVSMRSYSIALLDEVLAFAFYQSKIFVGGDLFEYVADRQADITQPRNVINLYYPDFVNGSGTFSNAARMPVSSSGFKPKSQLTRQTNARSNVTR